MWPKYPVLTHFIISVMMVDERKKNMRDKHQQGLSFTSKSFLSPETPGGPVVYPHSGYCDNWRSTIGNAES